MKQSRQGRAAGLQTLKALAEEGGRPPKYAGEGGRGLMKHAWGLGDRQGGAVGVIFQSMANKDPLWLPTDSEINKFPNYQTDWGK